jgi:uncharacterized protein
MQPVSSKQRRTRMWRTTPLREPITMSIASPCINICRMSPDTGWCEGCQRTIDEIRVWSTAADDKRLAILDAVAERRTFLLEAGVALAEGVRA